jgi:DNA-binding NtrC family response regulator
MRKKSVKKPDALRGPLLPISEARELLDVVCLVNSILRNGGNMSRAAAELDVARRTFYDMLEKYNISCSDGKLSIGLTSILSRLEIRASFLEDYHAQD